MSNTRQDPWDDFSHMPGTGPSVQQVMKNLRVFQEIFAQLPHKELIRRGWLVSVSDPSPLARVFFDLQAGHHAVLFRKNATANDSLVAVWLSRVRGMAEYRAAADQVPSFKGIERQDLRALARESVEVTMLPNIAGYLSAKGIMLIFVPALPGMKLDGAVFRLPTGQAVVAMSVRYSRLDNFWFTLLHELAHLVLHWESLDQPVLVDVEREEVDVAEKAANRLAKDAIVDRSAWRSAAPKYQLGDRAALLAFARKAGVHPALLAGLLRRELNRYTIYSDIVNEYDVREILNLT